MDDVINLHFGLWDILLLTVVTLQSTILAYLRAPKWKAFLLGLPIPFTLATVSVGTPVNATHAYGFVLTLLYTHGVRLFHARLGWPILRSILASVGGYLAAATLLVRVVPVNEGSFWMALGIALIAGGASYALTPARDEPGHRTPLPVWLKTPIIGSTIFILILLKKLLQGFMTGFPMVGLVAAYEARKSLATNCRLMSLFVLCAVPMQAAAHLLTPVLGLGFALLCGWVAFLSLMLPAMFRQMQAGTAGASVGEAEAG